MRQVPPVRGLAGVFQDIFFRGGRNRLAVWWIKPGGSWVVEFSRRSRNGRRGRKRSSEAAQHQLATLQQKRRLPYAHRRPLWLIRRGKPLPAAPLKWQGAGQTVAEAKRTVATTRTGWRQYRRLTVYGESSQYYCCCLAYFPFLFYCFI